MAATKANLTTVEVGRAPVGRFRALLGDGAWRDFERSMTRVADALEGKVVWNINSTAHGGGVAELLAALLPYDRDMGLDERWVVIEGSAAFFSFTKRIHTLLHGFPSDGSTISDKERHEYDATMARNAAALIDMVRPGDVVIIHDPQAAGLVPALAEHGALIIWRSHVGVDRPNQNARQAWDLLRPYLDRAAACVFSRATYAWEGLDRSRVRIIAPTIDPFSAKNRDLRHDEVEGILTACAVQHSNGREARDRRVMRQAVLSGEALAPETKVMLQVSRWDALKDPIGVLDAFALHVAPVSDAWLVLAGPAARSVRDDPEQPEVLRQVQARREGLAPGVRARTLIAQLPMEDAEENALMVNALQRRADVVVQKSLAEGFGLTVSEAMWKARPVVASRVGGIEDQIEDGKSGILVNDPKDLKALGEAVVHLLQNESEATRLSTEARKRVTSHFLVPRHLTQQADLILEVLGC
jgi:trehalose synthase